MAWPIALTDDTDLKKFVFVQRLTKMLETPNTFVELHKGAALAIRNYLESVGGIEDADLVENVDSFKEASANWLVWQVFRGHNEEGLRKLANEFRIQFRTNMKEITPLLSEDGKSGGVVAEVVLLKQAERSYFTSSRSGAIFKPRRR